MDDNRNLDEATLETLVPAFYAAVREDGLLGPVFDRTIVDWDDHLTRLVAFWSSVMLTSGRYKGNPVAEHAKHLGQLTPDMFQRWLALWEQTTDRLLAPAEARRMQDKATRIAESLKLALRFRPDSIEPAASRRSI